MIPENMNPRNMFNSHKETRITNVKVKDCDNCKGDEQLNSLIRKLLLCFPESIPDGQDEITFNIPAYVVEELRDFANTNLKGNNL